MASTSTLARPAALDRLGVLLAHALLVALVVMQLADLRVGLDGRPAICSLFLMGFSTLALITMPWLLSPRSLSATGRWVLASFTLLFCWALLSAWRTPLPRMFRPRVDISRIYLLMPPITGLVTMLAAWGLAQAVPPHRRRELLWRASMTLAGTTLVAGPRTMLANDSLRLGTGMGGAAVYHVVLLLAAAVLLESVLRDERRWWSLLGLVVCLASILLTGSRAGMLTLMLFLGALGVALVLRGRGRVVLWIAGGLVAAAVVLMAAVPTMRRLVQGHDAVRMANYETALRTWQSSDENILFGVGSGRMWPWYYFETGQVEVPWRGIIQTGFGRSTTNPHSVLLGVLGELGLVGLALLLVMVGAVLWHLVVRARALVTGARGASQEVWNRALADSVVVLALACTLVAFLFDYYLFKNYAISFWWWFVLAVTLGLAHHGEEAAS